MGKDCEEEYIVARSADEAREKAFQKYGKDVEIYQDPDVLDTWFSRSISNTAKDSHIFNVKALYPNNYKIILLNYMYKTSAFNFCCNILSNLTDGL